MQRDGRSSGGTGTPGYDHQDAFETYWKFQVDQAAKAFQTHASRQQVLGKAGKKLFPYYKYRFYQKEDALAGRSPEQRTVSVSMQAAKLSGRALRAAIAAVLKNGTGTHNAKVRRNSMKRLTYKDPEPIPLKFQGESIF